MNSVTKKCCYKLVLTSIFDGPGTITAAVWAIIMIQILGFIALQHQDNGTAYSFIILSCGLLIFMLTSFSLCLSISVAKHGCGFGRVFFSCLFKFILDL